jgi:hydrogenase large subunit
MLEEEFSMTAQAQVQTLDISPVGRVEGDLDVRIDIEDGVVTNAWTSAELFRGFEIILRDKDPQAGLVVTPLLPATWGSWPKACKAFRATITACSRLT